MEEENLMRYEAEKEMRARIADEKRAEREMYEKAEMRKDCLLTKSGTRVVVLKWWLPPWPHTSRP